MSRVARTTLTVIVCAVAVGLAAPTADAAAQADDFRLRERLAPGQTLEIRGVMGSIVAELGAGDAVEVTARKHARRDDPHQVTVEVVPHAGGVTICAVYPTPERQGRRENRCGPGGDYSMNTGNNDVQVDFQVRLPAGVHLTATNVSGDVEARGLRSDVDARTVSGSVRVSTTGTARAQSVSGNVEATLGSLGGSDPLEFKTVSGNVTVAIPADAAARVRLETVSGRFESDFPITAQGRMSTRRLEGTIGGGGRNLVLQTVSGNVRLRRGG
jgi:hypothetical protein